MHSNGVEGNDRLIRVGVIGAGVMGRNHVRAYGDLDGVELVAVADPDEPTLRRATRGNSRIHGYADYRAMLESERLDAVSIVVPTSLHAAIADDVIARGIDLLVEKPIALTAAEGREMVRHAREAGVLLAIGHIERFNPAVVELQRQLDGGGLGRVLQIKARRTGPFPERIRDVGVVIDLATHDLDLMLKLTSSNVQHVYAETICGVVDVYDDMVSALIRFENGVVGTLDVNRLTPTKVRDLVVVGTRGMFVVDYLTQDLYFYENSQIHDGWDHLAILNGVGEGKMIRYAVEREEPLKRELTSFARSVLRREEPEVTGKDGVDALALAEAILASGASSQVVSFPEGLSSWSGPEAAQHASGLP